MRNNHVCNTVEAKAKLNEMLDKVVGGKEVVITRRGKAVAKMVGVTDQSLDSREETKKFMEKLRAFHARFKKKRLKQEDTVVALLREVRRES